jgi:hypothetical protein
MRIKVVAQINFERIDDDGTKWSMTKQVPTFWVEAASHDEAVRIAHSIITHNGRVPIDWSIDTMTDYPAKNVDDEKPKSKDPYAAMTHEDFDRILADLVNQDGSDVIMSIPGVSQIVSEHYNNDVLKTWEEEQDDDEE